MTARLRFRSSALVVTLLGGGCDVLATVELPTPDLSAVTEQTLLAAIRAAQRAVRGEPGSASAWGSLGHVYLIHDWEAEAIQAYSAAVDLEPLDFRWRYHLGRALEHGDPEGALAAVQQAVELEAGYAPALVLHARLLRSLGRVDEAAMALRRAAEIDRDNPFSELGLGQLALLGGSFAAARARLASALTLNPGQSEAHQAMAQVWTALGEPDSAAAYAEQARAPTAFSAMEDPLWSEVEAAGATRYLYSIRGQRYLRARDFERAVAELSRAVTPEEKAPMLWYNYGAALLGAGQTAGAVGVLERALAATNGEEYRGKVEPASMVRIFTNLGLAHARVGDLPSAESIWRQGLEQSPGALELLNNLAALLFTQGRHDEAIELLQNSDATADDARLSAMLASMLEGRG